jgi:hypothetical protein
LGANSGNWQLPHFFRRTRAESTNLSANSNANSPTVSDVLAQLGLKALALAWPEAALAF